MLTLILGGARSGKSRFAQSLCQKKNEAVYYVATARFESGDEEMTARIRRHQADRPAHWGTIEESIQLIEKIKTETPEEATVLVDCLTVWLSNLMWEARENTNSEIEKLILNRVEDFTAFAADDARNVIAVSNEVGGGIVPDNPVGRSFRDLQGLTNQFLASKAERVILVVAGLPLTLKG